MPGKRSDFLPDPTKKGRSIPLPPTEVLGIVDPNSKFRTTAFLLSVLSGRAEGAIEHINLEYYEKGSDLRPDAPDFDERFSKLPVRPHHIDPARLNRFAEGLATQALVAHGSEAPVPTQPDPSAPADSPTAPAQGSTN